PALGLRDVAKIDLRVTPSGQVWFLSSTALPSFDPSGAVFAASTCHGLSYTATVLTTLKSAALRAGLDPTKTKSARGKRSSLKVGFAFNMKRSDTTADDSEAEYDSPRTIEAISKAIEGYGHQVVHLEATRA